MRDVLSWSLSFGRWADVHVRLHAFFLVLVAFVFHAAMVGNWPYPYAVALSGILLASLLLHEAAHVLAARRCGGQADQILIWPLGGLVPAHAPHDERAELLVAVAGPLANLLASAATLPALLILKKWSLGQLANPLVVPYIAEPLAAWSYLPQCLALVFWLNWVLFLVNLLPAFPLDGGRILKAALCLAFGQRSVGFGTVMVAQLTGIGLFVAAWWVHKTAYAYAWAPLVLLGVVVFFSGKSEVQGPETPLDDDPLGYDFSQGYTSLERDPEESRGPQMGVVSRWLAERREARQERQRQIEEDEERRMDDILARLHITGLSGLSAEDRELLNRVSARYRNRQKQ